VFPVVQRLVFLSSSRFSLPCGGAPLLVSVHRCRIYDCHVVCSFWYFPPFHLFLPCFLRVTSCVFFGFFFSQLEPLSVSSLFFRIGLQLFSYCSSFPSASFFPSLPGASYFCVRPVFFICSDFFYLFRTSLSQAPQSQLRYPPALPPVPAAPPIYIVDDFPCLPPIFSFGRCDPQNLFGVVFSPTRGSSVPSSPTSSSSPFYTVVLLTS